tara:strand:+ start:3351 stop:4589 length:1239 start_codon:yes stop_codon:yes gene_type:complete
MQNHSFLNKYSSINIRKLFRGLDSIMLNYFYFHRYELSNFRKNGFNSSIFAKSISFFLATFLFLPLFYIFFKSLFISHKKINLSGRKNICFAFCNTTINKINKLPNKTLSETLLLYDDLRLRKSRHSGVIEQFSILERLGVFFSGKFYYEIYKETQKLDLLSKRFGYDHKTWLIFFTRFPLDIFVNILMTKILNENTYKSVISGSTNENYGILLQKTCDQKFQTVCIPHGMSPSIYLPNKIFGDTYYAITKEEQIALQNNYPDKKIILDEGINKKVYSWGNYNVVDNNDLVYFTNSRDNKLDQMIIDHISSNFKQLFVKLHPLNKNSDFKIAKNVEYIENFKELDALIITRPSTIIAEANLNNRRVVCLVFSEADYKELNYLYSGNKSGNLRIIKSFNELTQYLKNWKKRNT